ncbi:MAG: hypothetical protein Q7S84_01475 [bacterium]|nr:hypothetical protein [bacterium]
MKKATRNFPSVEAFVKSKFRKLMNSMTLVTSLSVTDTINGKNAIVVMAKTKGVSGLIRDASGSTAIRVLSDSTDNTASIAVLHYSPARRDVEGWVSVSHEILSPI